VSSPDLPTDGLITGGFDLSDALIRSLGEDPYAARKLALLDRTRDERAAIARVHHGEALERSVSRLRDHLAAIWSRGDLDAAARRQILFELWDECAERGSAADLAAAGAARATIIGFIRRRLPKGTAAAYSAAELARLNDQRSSRARFEPY
jgi:hypothetical protein